MHRIISEVDKVDYVLQKMSSANKTYIKHASFKNNAKVERVVGLKLNKLLNAKLKHKWLEDVGALDDTTFNSKKKAISQIMVSVKVNWALIFNLLK